MEGISGLYLILFLISLGLAAFFCSAETAFISMQKLRLQQLLQAENPRAKTVARILERPEKFLATVLLGINFFETAVATLGTIMAVTLWGEDLGSAIAIILITVITLLLAEFIPKSLAARYGEGMALLYAKPIEIIAFIFYPFVYVLNLIGIRFTRFFGKNDEVKPTFSYEDFRAMISVGHKEGTVKKGEAEMLDNVFEFGNRPVKEIMVPRTEVIWVTKGTRLADFLKLYAQNPLSRFPVYEDNIDNVVGILAVKDILMAQAKGTFNEEDTVDDLIRPAYFTPETKRVSELFTEMRDKNYRMAIIIDEFGGTAGIVSLSGLMEEIVGPVGDELADIEKDYETINEYTFQVDGGMRVEEANEEMKLNIPEGNYETVAGFVLDLLGHIPKQGEQLKYKDCKMIVTEMRGMKIEKIRLIKEKHAENPG